MRKILCTLVLLSLALAHSDAPAADELSRLRQRISELEAENQTLRDRLNRIAELAAVLPDSPAGELSISLISNEWGEASPADVTAVLKSSAAPLWNSAGQPRLHAVTVKNGRAGPLVEYQRGDKNEYVVRLDVHGRYWAKLSYQFSHEIGHILCNYRNVPNRQMWFEEALCECASLYTLRAMGKSWKTSPPYSNWTPYADSLTEYASNRISESTESADISLAAWYDEHRNTLDSTATDRQLNLVVAIRLLEIFENTPDSWIAVRSLNRGDPAENETLARYLTAWHARTEEPHKQVVRQIADLFEIELP